MYVDPEWTRADQTSDIDKGLELSDHCRKYSLSQTTFTRQLENILIKKNCVTAFALVPIRNNIEEHSNGYIGFSQSCRGDEWNVNFSARNCTVQNINSSFQNWRRKGVAFHYRVAFLITNTGVNRHADIRSFIEYLGENDPDITTDPVFLKFSSHHTDSESVIKMHYIAWKNARAN